MRKHILIAAALIMAASCAQENMIEPEKSDLSKVSASSEKIEIKVTLPEVKTVDVKASLTENSVGNMVPAWTDGDQILVGGEPFTLVSVDGMTGTFSGYAPQGGSFDIVYPAAMADGSQVAVQAADGDLSHLKYHASLKGVNSYDDVHFSHGWAAEHGGEFSQMGCLKLVLNLPGTIEEIKSVKVYGDGYQTMQIGVEDSGFTDTDSTFTAYLPYDNIVLDSEKLLVVEVGVSDDVAYSNRFYPGSQTLHDGYVSQLVTSVAKWRYALKGNGTEQDPYLIASAEDFAAMHDYLSLNTYTYFRQTKDIDCSTLTSWTPVNDQNAAFGIMYDGDDKTISKFTLKSEHKWASIFGVVHGTIKDLKVDSSSIEATGAGATGGIIAAWVGNIDNTLQGRIENVHVTNSAISIADKGYVGGIAGQSGSGRFVNCSFNGTVTRVTSGTADTNYPIAGILAYAREDVELKDCHTSGDLKSNQRYICGGVVGWAANKIKITECSNAMTLYSKKGYVGGILGLASEGGEISGCFNTGKITSDATDAGGIIGGAKSVLTVSKCHNTGAITSKSRYVGGIIGRSQGTASVSECYNTGNMTTTYSSTTASNTAGIMGLSSGAVEIARCYNTGVIKAANSNMVGGILSTGAAAVTISDCYSTGDISTKHSAGGIMGNAPKNTTISNCYSMGSVTTTNYSAAGILGRAVGGVASSSFSVDQVDSLIVENCISFNSSIKSTGGIKTDSNYSIAPIVGFSSPKNTLRNCWRSPDVTVSGYNDTQYNTLTDTEDSDATNPLPYTCTSPLKWYAPYNGKVVAAGTTLSTVAKNIGWSETTWDLLGDTPALKCFQK